MSADAPSAGDQQGPPTNAGQMRPPVSASVTTALARIDSPVDRGAQAKEHQLEQLLGSLTKERSELAIVRTLARARVLYEALHPETKHGGDRTGQVPESGTWPSFARHVAETRGLALSTIYAHLQRAEKLQKLDPEAERACYGTALANQLGLVVRIAALPDPEVQLDLVTAFDRQRTLVRRNLADYERKFGLTSEASPRTDAVIAGSPSSETEAQHIPGMEGPPATVRGDLVVATEESAEAAPRRILATDANTEPASVDRAEPLGSSKRVKDAMREVCRLLDEIEKALRTEALAHELIEATQFAADLAASSVRILEAQPKERR